MEIEEVEVTSNNEPPHTDNSFFATQSNYDHSKSKQAELSVQTKRHTTKVSLKATSFYNSKNKPNSSNKVKGGEGRVQFEEEDPSISYKSVKHFSKKFNLPNKDVYELVTQYNSMVTISNTPDIKNINKDDKTEEKTKQKSSRMIGMDEAKPQGIKIDVLNKYSKLLADKHPDVVPMILKGVGVDVLAKDPRISLNSFFNLNCILEYGVANKNELIQFWTRVLDPDNILLVK